MPQFPIPAGKKVGDLVDLSPADSKHLSGVLRSQKGERLIFFNGSDRFIGEVLSTGPRNVTIRLIDQIPAPVLKGDVTLCQAILKKDKMEWVVQKAVELGAARLIPFSSERTISKEVGQSKIDRWRKIDDEALKQCGRVTPMTIDPPTSFSKLVQAADKDSLLILFHSETAGFSESRFSPLSKICCLIGPEGGFSEKEVEMARQAGCAIRSLGPLTLRSETAAVAALTLIQHELGNI